MLVDSNGILLFFPFLRCYFLIFFYFYNSSLGLFNLLTKLLELRSIIAFKLAIFYITYLNHFKFTARFGVPEIHPHTTEGSTFLGYFDMLSGTERNSSAPHRN